MATFDDLQILNAQFGQALAPINRLSEGRLNIAAQELARRRQLEDEARKNFFTQELLDQQHQFQTTRDEAQRRAQFGLLDKGEEIQVLRDARTRQTELENTALGSIHSEKLFQQGQRGKDADEKRARLRVAREYGLDFKDTASPFDIEQGIQGAASKSLGATLSQVVRLGADLQVDSGKDPVEAESRVRRELIKSEKFQALLSALPQSTQIQIRSGLLDDMLQVKSIPAILDLVGSKAWLDKNKKLEIEKRKLDFLQAMSEISSKLTEEEVQNPDARKRPDYLQKLNTFKILQDKARADIANLRNPIKVQETFEALENSVRPPAKTTDGLPPLPPPPTARERPSVVGQNGSAAFIAPRTVPSAVQAPVPFPDRVKNILNTAPSLLKQFVPKWASEQLGGRHNSLTDEQSDKALVQYAASLRAEIARLLSVGPGQRGMQSRLDVLRSELARIQ